METTTHAALRRADLVDLAHPGATDASLAGAKAANLARARAAGLPVLPGVVLTTAWDHGGWSHPSRYGRPSPARTAWDALAAGGEIAHGPGDLFLVTSRYSHLGSLGDELARKYQPKTTGSAGYKNRLAFE